MVIVDCIAPMIAAELRQELDKANFIYLTIDALKSKEQRAGTLESGNIGLLTFHSGGNEGGGAFLYKHYR